MDKDLLQNFDAFRKWFNKRFSLSLNGKFVGLKRLHNWRLFAYRLYKYFSGRYPFSRVSNADTMSFVVGKDRIKLYNR